MYGGELVDLADAIDLHCHPYPDLFPRLGDDLDVARSAQAAGFRAVVLKCHHESTVSRAYHTEKAVPGIRVFGGIVLNGYVGSLNPAAVEASLRLGGRVVWMPTVDAGYHAEIHGSTGGYENQRGGRHNDPVWVQDAKGRIKPEVLEIMELVREYGAILGTCHLSPKEIVALVREARTMGLEKIVVTHPFFKVPNLDIPTLRELVRLGAMPEFGYCTISPAWQYASPAKIVQAVTEVGADRCLLVSDTGQRHNPMPSEALRVFAQTLFEAGLSTEQVIRMVTTNPRQLLDLPEAITAGPEPISAPQ